ncbi:MAG: right-handed parallel beta-helix repeat-containing protein [Candidatus Doudnabacteria bacterium]|nr:right-handed parallel beta-helix repeat-containing protein [Candidatus Doudnabacteria bacterium]
MPLNKAIIARICVLALIFGIVSAAQPAQAAHIACGEILTSSTKLDADLVCLFGSGLIIGANGVSVNLNGYTITGDPSVGGSYGIDNTGGFDNVTVKNGKIVGFEQGIRMIGAEKVNIKDLEFSGQTSSHAIDIKLSEDVAVKNSSFVLPTVFLGPEAVRLQSVDNVNIKDLDIDGGFIGINFACFPCDGTPEAPTTGTVKNNLIKGAFTGVLIANSDDAYVKNNTIRDGVSVVCGFCGPLTIPARGIHVAFLSNSGTKISGNEVFDNDGIGIRASGDGTTTGLEVSKNEVHDNASDGIQLHDAQVSKIAKNEVKDNGGDGISLLDGSAGNSVEKNVVSGSGGSDLLHDLTSSPNTWKKNTCGTSSGADIPPC